MEAKFELVLQSLDFSRLFEQLILNLLGLPEGLRMLFAQLFEARVLSLELLFELSDVIFVGL